MYNSKSTDKSKHRYLLITLGLILFLSTILFVLEKTGVTNLYTSASTPASPTKPTSEVPSANPTNTVDYTAPKTEDASTIPDKNPNQTAPTPNINPDLAVVITSTRVSGSNFLIKAVISGTDSATCSATMTKGSLTATASSGASMIEGQYSCKDLSVPMSQLSESGDWSLKLLVTDKTGASATTSQDVKL